MGEAKIPTKLLKKLDINGLQGRLLVLPKPNKKARTILLVYGIGSSLERIYPLAKSLNKRCGVVVPDLPGFGGMDSLAQVGLRPSLENQTEYLVTIIKFHFQKQRLVLAGLDYGFAVVDQLLRQFPELRERVDFSVSLAGINDWRELQMSFTKVHSQRLVSTILARQLPSGVARAIAQIIRPGLKDIRPDLRTYLQSRYDLLHLKHAHLALPLPVYYFPGADCLEVDQTKVILDLQTMYQHVTVVTDSVLTCSRDSVSLTVPRKKTALEWLRP